jgi:uncharacterized protein (TIGR02466 family)
MELINIFSTPIWRSEFPEFDKFQEIFLEKIQEFRKNNPESDAHSNVNGYQSPNGIHMIEEFSSLFNYVCFMVNQSADDLKFKDRDIFITSSWVNIADSRSSMMNHHTHEHTFSGIFYLKFPENSGKLCLINEGVNTMWNGAKLIDQKINLNAESVKIEPSEGDIILFPSYLPHSVDTNNHDDERISISFNILLMPKNVQNE